MELAAEAAEAAKQSALNRLSARLGPEHQKEEKLLMVEEAQAEQRRESDRALLQSMAQLSHPTAAGAATETAHQSCG